MPDEEAHREFLLSALRTASLRLRLMDNEITTVGIALRHEMIVPDIAVKWISDLGLMWLIEPLPPEVGAVALVGEATKQRLQDEVAR